MAAPKKIRTKAGTVAPTPSGPVQVPVDENDLRATVVQLQNTVNALIATVNANVTKFNAHTHTANDTAVIVGQREAAHTAAAAAATDLFTAS